MWIDSWQNSNLKSCLVNPICKGNHPWPKWCDGPFEIQSVLPRFNGGFDKLVFVKPTTMCRFRIHPKFTYYYSQDFLGKILDTKTHNVISLPKLCDISGYKTGFYLHTATENKKGVSCTQTCCSHVIQKTKHVLLYPILCMVFVDYSTSLYIYICHCCVSKTTKELITLYIEKQINQ